MTVAFFCSQSNYYKTGNYRSKVPQRLIGKHFCSTSFWDFPLNLIRRALFDSCQMGSIDCCRPLIKQCLSVNLEDAENRTQGILMRRANATSALSPPHLTSELIGISFYSADQLDPFLQTHNEQNIFLEIKNILLTIQKQRQIFFPSRDAHSITFLQTHPTFDISTDFQDKSF